MDENKNNSSMYDIEDEEGATTVLCAPGTEDYQEDESEGATTVLTGPDPVSAQNTGMGAMPKFSEQTVLVSPQPGPMPGPMGGNGMPAPGPMGGNGMPAPGPMGGNGMPAPGPMGGNGMPQPGLMPGTMPGPMGGNGMVPNNGQMPQVGVPPMKSEKPKKEKKEKKKKTGLIVAICVVVVLALLAGGYFLFFTPEKRYERKLAKGQEAFDAQNYQAAEEAFDDALEIFNDRIPAIYGLVASEVELCELDDAMEDFEQYRAVVRDADAETVEANRDDIVQFYMLAVKIWSDYDKQIEVCREGYNLTQDTALRNVLVEAYIKKADACEDSDYEAKIDAYTEAVKLDNSNVDAASGRIECAYAALDDMMLAEQYDEAEAFISKYESIITDADFSDYSVKIESERALATARHDVMEKAISLMSAGDYEGMLDVDGSEEASLIVDNMDGDRYIYAQDGFTEDYTGKAAGIYQSDNGYYFYYGDYENGVRSGTGSLFVKLDGFNGNYEIYEGDWKDDKPNGQGLVSNVNGQSDSGAVTITETGSFVDGLVDGEISVVLNTEEGDFTGTFTATKGEVSDVRGNYPNHDFSGVPEGRVVYVILSNDNDSLFWWYSCREGDLLGAYGFAQ